MASRPSARVRSFAVGLAAAMTIVAACTTAPPEPAGTASSATGSATAASSTSPTTSATATSTPIGLAALPELVETQLRTYSFFDHVRAVLVEVDGEVVVEKYWQTDAFVSRNSYSVTKSVLSTLVGMAIDEGVLPGVDTDLATLLPDRAATMTPEVAAITLEQLLTMTSGLPDSTPAVDAVFTSPDWVTAILERGTDRPAGRFAYSDLDPHLVAAVLARATGETVYDYAAARLFEPLGIETTGAPDIRYDDPAVASYRAAGPMWPYDNQGLHVGPSELRLTPLHMLALGRLYLDGGRVGDRQVVPAARIAEATSPHLMTRSWHLGGGYGYYWWTGRTAGEPTYAAIGRNGQLIHVVPGLGLIVVVSSDPQETGDPVPPVNGPELMVSLVERVVAPVVAAR